MTMNEMSDETRREYDWYANEVQQLEWEKAEQARKLRWVEDSLRQALAEFDAEQAADSEAGHHDITCEQAQHHVPEHTNANATQVAADDMVTGDVSDVKRIDTKGWGVGMGDEPESCPHCAIRGCEGQCREAWEEKLDDLMSHEELERAEREAEEGRDDH